MIRITARRRFLSHLLTLASVLAVSLSLQAAPPPGILDASHASVRAVIAVQGAVTTDLMKVSGIMGTAVGLGPDEQPSLIVFVDSEATGVADLVRALPPQIRGIGVSAFVTDKFRAFAGKPSSGGNTYQVKQSLPIQLGTSGGWRNDLANGYCCGGTLGSLIQVNGIQYILSNYHVLEADIVGGGNSLTATTGSYVIQPGLIDVGCNAASSQNVATLVKLSALPASNVDCAVAQVVPGAVRADGAILGIGTLSSQTAAAALNKAVKKSGRTTGLTRSSISGLNATVSVSYENECAGGAAFTKTFTGQIVIANRRSGFLAGGDSGSLMVEDISTNPRAVGLLYAGSSTTAIANPIDQVLNFLGTNLGGTATMVGN